MCKYKLLSTVIFTIAISTILGCSLNYRYKMLNVVDVSQSNSYTCGVSCAQAILNYYGIDRREDQLAEQFGTTEDAGTSPSQIMSGLESYGLVVTIKENSTLDDLRSNIKNKIPTMVAIQAWLDTYPSPDWSNNWEDGHWVIVIGMDNENIYFEDPSLSGSHGWMTQKEFLARWHDYTGDIPCCDENDKQWLHLSISVKGKSIKNTSNRHIDKKTIIH